MATPVGSCRVRPSVPGPGVVLSSETERRAVHVRKAVAIAAAQLCNPAASVDYLRLFASRWKYADLSASDEALPQRAAWAVVTVYLVARAVNIIGPQQSLAEAERWFVGDLHNTLPSLCRHVPDDVQSTITSHLNNITYGPDFSELLPYVLEPHGPGTRLSVMRDPATSAARKRKRESGVFYTPADVAEYMACQVLSQCGAASTTMRAVDPAVGTGVFLRALLHSAIKGDSSTEPFEYVSRCLFGIDISPLALQSASFLLLHDCLTLPLKGLTSVWAAWQRIRLNFCAADALMLCRRGNHDLQYASAEFETIQGELIHDPRSAALRPQPRSLQGAHQSSTLFDDEHGPTLHTVFPSARTGFDIVIGNPPYARLGMRKAPHRLGSEFASLSQRAGSRDNLYPLFVELMWRFAKPHHASAMVVPLSVAYHRGGQLTACRRAITRVGGQWKFAFFDREPHALFGEEVKTRNAILLHFRADADDHKAAAIYTSAMRKWTSRTRHRLFSEIQFTPIESDIAHGIPKLQGTPEASAVHVLRNRSEWLLQDCRSVAARTLEAAFTPCHVPIVFVGSTAYNFINVFRPRALPTIGPEPLSQNSILELEFVNETDASAAFAILSSRLVFWWWHVHCDGFHVPRWFVDNVPLQPSKCSSVTRGQLAILGNHLWNCTSSSPLISVNGGKQSVAFRPFAGEAIRDQIDVLLIDSAGIGSDFADELRRFFRATVVVDEGDQRRVTRAACLST